MKKRIAVLLISGVFFAGGVFFWTLGSSSAQENPAKSSYDSTIVQKLDALIGQLSKLTDLISVKKDGKEDELKGGKYMGTLMGNPPGCGRSANWDLWSQSFYRKDDRDWNVNDFPEGLYSSNYEERQMTDLNGDGLVDYFYTKKYFAPNYSGQLYDEDLLVSNYIQEDTCIMLNNGHGWDLIYKCSTDRKYISGSGNNKIYKIVYYGDCADTTQ